MNNKSLKFKLYTLSAILILMSIIVGTIATLTEEKMVNEYSYIIHRNLPNIKSMGLMVSRYRLARIHITELAIPGLPLEDGKKSIKEYKESWENFEVEHKKYLAVEFAPGEDEIYQEFKKSFEAVKKSMDSIVDLYEKGVAAGAVNHSEILNILMKEVQVHGSHVRDHGNKLMQFHVDRADMRASSAIKISKQSTVVVFSSIAVGALIGVIFAVIFSNGLVSALSRISDSLNQAGIEVSEGSNQVASTAQELSQSNTEQSASLEEAAASIEEMSSMIQRSNENAKKTYEYAINSKDSAVNGKQVVLEMMGSIEEINQSNSNIMSAIDESNKRMEEIVTVIGDIGNKTKVINDIVFQTKLLSFNASVEAARAGEMGKGFAVVAEEVGNLAAMSGNAAKEISEMLTLSMSKVDDIVKTTKTNVERLIEDGKRKVEAGTVVARKCGDVLDTIVINVDGMTKLANEISVASNEQSKGIQEISKATSMLGAVTQQNSLASEESSKASEDLSRQAMALNNLVGELVQTINGSRQTQVAISRPVATKAVQTNVLAFKKEKEKEKEKEEKKIVHKTPKVSNVKVPMPAPAKVTIAKEIPRKSSVSATVPLAEDDRFVDA